MPETGDDGPFVYLDTKRVAISMDSERLRSFLEKLKDRLPLLLEQRHAVMDKYDGNENATDAMHFEMVMNSSEICGAALPFLSFLMENLLLWFRRDDGRLFQLNHLRTTDGMLVFEFGERYMSLEPKTTAE